MNHIRIRLLFLFLFSGSWIPAIHAQEFSPFEMSMIRFVESLSSYGDYTSFSPQDRKEIDSAVNWLNSVDQDQRFLDFGNWLYYHRGRLYLVQNRYEPSRQDLERAIQLDSLDADVMDRICVLSAHLKNYTRRKFYLRSGVTGYEQKLRTDSTNDRDWYAYARFLDLQSQFTSIQT